MLISEEREKKYTTVIRPISISLIEEKERRLIT